MFKRNDDTEVVEIFYIRANFHMVKVLIKKIIITKM